MPVLEVVPSLDKIDCLFQQLTDQHIPGFQISPDINVLDAKLRIEEVVCTVIPEFRFNQNETCPRIANPKGEWHIDGTARNNSGVLLHETTSGVGAVVLRLAKPDENSYPRQIGWLRKKPNYVGPRFTGILLPGMLTVFSEGIKSELLSVDVGPTAHKFTTNPGTGFRKIRRYGWQPTSSTSAMSKSSSSEV